MSDRHKTPRVYASGASKRHNKKQKQKKDDDLLSRTHKLTDFFSQKEVCDLASEMSENDDFQNPENDFNCNVINQNEVST